MIVDLIGFGIVMPVLPFYAREYGADASLLGLLLMGYAAAQFACAPLWGRLSDRIGRRPVLLVTVAGTALALLALGLARGLVWVFAARVLGGVFAANVSVASAYVADVTAPEERTRYMGLLGASFGIGFLVGPAIGGALAPFGYHVPMLAAAGLAGANWLHALVSLREPEADGVRAVGGEAAAPGEPDARGAAAAGPAAAPRARVLRQPLVRRLCASNLLFSIAVTQLETVFAFFMMDRFGYDAQHVAAILVAMAVVMGGVQGGGMKALAARFAERDLLLGGSALLALAFLAVPEMPTVPWLMTPLLVAAVGRAVAQPSLMSMTSLAALASERGAVMGAFQAAASLARVVGPVVAGLLYDRAQSLPFVLAALLLVATIALARRLPRRDAEPHVLASAERAS